MQSEKRGLAALLLVTAVWGTTFPAMKLLSGQLDALQIIWLRFALALLVLAPLWVGMRPKERLWGRTSSNRNAFVTGLNVLVVPVLAMLVFRRNYGWRLWAACALAVAGMALMFHEDEPWNLGDTLTLCSTLFYAIYILLLEACARRNVAKPLRAARMAAAQAGVMCLAAFVLLLVRHGSSWRTGMDALDAPSWAALIYLGVLASVLVVTLQAWGQQRVDAMRSAIVFGLEPVFAALTAWVLLGESLGWSGLSGAAMILALIWSQWQPAPALTQP